MRELLNIADKIDWVVILAIIGIILSVIVGIFIVVKFRGLNLFNKKDKKKLPLDRILWH
jgi:hypothetical protein